MKPRPRVSAIIPAHNAAADIAAAIRSVRGQTVPVYELIVIDDGSSDDTAQIVADTDPDAILLRQAQQGPASARNVGAARASGDFLAFLDHDDLWPRERMASFHATLETAPEAQLVCGRIEVAAARPEVTPDPRLASLSGQHVPFLFPAALIRRSLWERLGGMNPAHDRAEDTDLYLRMREAGVTPLLVDTVTLIYRQSGRNRSRAVDLAQEAMLLAMRASIARRRAGV